MSGKWNLYHADELRLMFEIAMESGIAKKLAALL